MDPIEICIEIYLKTTSAYSPKGVPLYFSPLLLELFTREPSFPLFSNGNLSKYLFDSKYVRQGTTFVNVLPLNYYTIFIYLFIHSFIHSVSQSFIIIVNLSNWSRQNGGRAEHAREHWRALDLRTRERARD